jgi:hypothetical protein
MMGVILCKRIALAAGLTAGLSISATWAGTSGTVHPNQIGAESQWTQIAFQPRKRIQSSPKIRVIEKGDTGRNDVDGAIWQYTATQPNTISC